MKKIHTDIRIYGVVQGVGFRPFVHKAASELDLFGFVRNTSYGAELALEGKENAVDSFLEKLRTDAPRLAFIESIDANKSDELCGYRSFEIAPSERGSERRTLISPDVAICEDCLRELFDENDRRYKYPFINCTNCGPRFTIIRDIPYDRKNTTMAPFMMCDECAAEYGDIDNRRYHAQPDCCVSCGPKLQFFDEDGRVCDGDATELARQYIKDGKIVAIKGLGGIHLACRFDDERIVARLRERKRRDEKPLAVMCRDIETVQKLAEVSDDERKYLISHRRPIVLLRKKEKKSLLHLSENAYIGVMLPYAPVHYLLLSDGLSAVVMTSANVSELPIMYKDCDAKEELHGIADGFLLNNREIHTRCDDSLTWVYKGNEYFARRSRGYVPNPLCFKDSFKPILACGAEQKASFAITRDNHVFPSQHIGDLKNLETLENFEEQIAHFENIFDIKPEVIVCDMHPDYMSTAYAEERAKREGMRICRVQHHHAHMAACMADNGFDGDCIGVVWDGTGFGGDGKSWGAEFLVGDFSHASRRGTILPIRLPGADRAVKEVSRTGQSLLESSGIECDEKIKGLLASGINCPEVTSMGRLFDGVAAIIGIKESVSYEGQAAILLEAAAEEGINRIYPYSIKNKDGMYVFDWREMICELVYDKEQGTEVSEMAATFMNTLVAFASETVGRISEDTGIKTVALSGGTFQNMYILQRLDKNLADMGYKVLTHRRVSCNDEGISLGQIMIANNQ